MSPRSASARVAGLLAGVLLCAACAGAAGGPAPVAPGSAPATAPAPGSPAPGGPSGPPAAPVVLLDPGHNGGNAGDPAAVARPVDDGRGATKPCNTTGTSTDDGYPEHAFAWDLAGRVRAELEKAGYRVVLTRADDDGVGPCVDERGTAGARVGAVAAVSLHADGAPPGGRGFHVAYAAPPLRDVQDGPARALATALRDALRGGRFTPADYLGTDGLDGRADLAGLNLAAVPTVLVECANMRNPAEARLVSSADGRDRYARAIAAGIRAFVGT